MISRINLYGGPGVGKSTMAARIFAHLKQQGQHVELVQEFIKQRVYADQPLTPWDQIHTFGQQFEAELRPLQGGIDRVVTDSPLLLQAIYAELNNCPSYCMLRGICYDFDEDYPSLDFLIHRNPDNYQRFGRWQDLGEAMELDRIIENTLIKCGSPYMKLDPQIPASVENCFNLLETT